MMSLGVTTISVSGAAEAKTEPKATKRQKSAVKRRGLPRKFTHPLLATL